MKLKLAREFRHLTWLEGHKDARHNIASSSVLTLSLEDIGPLETSQQVGAANPRGDPELVELISRTYGVDAGSVVVTNGAGEANALTTMVCVEKGCEVLAETPVYQSLVEIPRFLGARIVHFGRRMGAGFAVDIEEVKRLISRRTRLVILSNLHNPSCAMVEERELRALAEVAEDAGARVLSDEVYLDCATGLAPPPLAALSPAAISTNSLSKAYGAGGFRMGWMLGPPDAVRAVEALRDHTTIAPNRIGEEVVKNILRRRSEFLARTLRLTRLNTRAMERWVLGRDDVDWVRPPAGTVCFPRVRKRTSTLALGQKAYEEEGVLAVPGEFFGCPGHFRIGLGGDPGVLLKGLEGLGKVLDRSK